MAPAIGRTDVNRGKTIIVLACFCAVSIVAAISTVRADVLAAKVQAGTMALSAIHAQALASAELENHTRADLRERDDQLKNLIVLSQFMADELRNANCENMPNDWQKWWQNRQLLTETQNAH
jgi:hypothetical protein